MVALLILPLLREFGLYGLVVGFRYAVYGPVMDQGVAVKYFCGPNTNAHESLLE